MEGFLQYWFMFPISILICTIATASGIGGSVFFSPIFIIWLDIDPFTAIGTAIISEVFGFSSGMYGYFRARLIDYPLGRNLLLFSIPTAIAGVLLAGYIPGYILEVIFAVGVFFVGWQIFLSAQKDKKDLDAVNNVDAQETYESKLTDLKGNVYYYTICHRNIARVFSAIGGVFYGMISVGLAEMQEYLLIVKCKVPTKITVATSIFLVAVTAIAASVVRILMYVQAADYETLILISQIVIYTAPGVLIGGQIGPLLQQKINPTIMKPFIAFLLIGVGLFMSMNLFV